MFNFVTIEEEYDIIMEALEKTKTRKEYYIRVVNSLRRNGLIGDVETKEGKKSFIDFFYSKSYEKLNLKACRGLGKTGIEILNKAYTILES